MNDINQNALPGYCSGFLNSIGFPSNADELFSMIIKHEDDEFGRIFDSDIIMDYEESDIHYWYSPRWAQAGDLSFFYLTKRGLKNARACFNEIKKWTLETFEGDEEIDSTEKLESIRASHLELLQEEIEFLSWASGCVFAVGRLGGNVSPDLDGDREYHFKGTTFAPLASVFVLDKFIPIEEFYGHVRVSQSTITPLTGAQLEGVREIILEYSSLPEWASLPKPRMFDLRDVDGANWRSRVCGSDVAFLLEEQVRGYFVDHFLRGIADRGSLLEECECRDASDRSLGRVDYMIRFEGSWLPVEVKLLWNANHLPQCHRYLRTRSFHATRGPGQGKTEQTPPLSQILVIDRDGVSLLRNDSEHSHPELDRVQLMESNTATERDWLRSRLRDLRSG